MKKFWAVRATPGSSLESEATKTAGTQLSLNSQWREPCGRMVPWYRPISVVTGRSEWCQWLGSGLREGETLTKAVLKDEASLEGDAVDECNHLGCTVVQMNAVETARVEEAKGNRDTGAHQDREVANIGEVALATETVGGIGVRTLRCQIELEVVVCAAEALDEGQPLDLRVGELDLVELRSGVLRVWAGIGSDIWWIYKCAVVWIVGRLLFNELGDDRDSSSEAEACREGSNLAEHDDEVT